MPALCLGTVRRQLVRQTALCAGETRTETWDREGRPQEACLRDSYPASNTVLLV